MTDANLLIPAAQYLRMSTEHQSIPRRTSPLRSRSTQKPTDFKLSKPIPTLRKAA